MAQGWIDDMSEEDLAALAESMGELGVSEDRLDANARQMALADALRQTAMPEGRQAGGTFVAANPLEFLGTSLSRIKGGRDARKTEGERASIVDQIKGARGKLAGAYMKRQPFGFGEDEQELPEFYQSPEWMNR